MRATDNPEVMRSRASHFRSEFRLIKGNSPRGGTQPMQGECVLISRFNKGRRPNQDKSAGSSCGFPKSQITCLKHFFERETMINREESVLILFCMLAFLPGCGDGRQYVPVSGLVTLDGQPLRDVNLLFEPLSGSGKNAPGAPSIGQTNAEGHYALNCPLTNRVGAVVGRHQVSIFSNDRQEFTQEQIDTGRKYLSELTKTPAEELSDATVIGHLHAVIQPPREIVPIKYNRQSELTYEVTQDGPNEINFSLSSD